MQTTVVAHELELTLVLPAGRRVPVPARFAYHTDDPYAVRVVFHLGSGQPVEWAFARELLVEGIFRPCGLGDVRIRPARAGRRDAILIGLSSPEGRALLEAPVVPLSAWLRRTLRAVPQGAEAERLGLDDGLAGLLA